MFVENGGPNEQAEEEDVICVSVGIIFSITIILIKRSACTQLAPVFLMMRSWTSLGRMGRHDRHDLGRDNR